MSRSAYNHWLTGKPSARSLENASLKKRILELHEQARGQYGHRPLHRHLQEEALSCGRDRTLSLMKELELCVPLKKGFKPQGTNSAHDFGYSPNRLKELGKPERMNQVWVADTTYLRTDKGWCYLATVMDLFSRRILGWSVSEHNDSKLTCAALRAAALTRNGQSLEGIIHHSDRGSTYASYAYTQLLQSLKLKASMSAKGNCYDNAAQESFYGRYKTAAVRNRVFADVDAARSHAFEYIEIFYNRFRKHSSLDYHSPIQFEQKFCPHGGKQPASTKACLNNN